MVDSEDSNVELAMIHRVDHSEHKCGCTWWFTERLSSAHASKVIRDVAERGREEPFSRLRDESGPHEPAAAAAAQWTVS